MPPAKFLAVDFGAESGKAFLGILNKGRISIEEIHRFPNRQILEGGKLRWDMNYLFNELTQSLTAACRKGHKDLRSMGVDTWGVDFGLIGAFDELQENPVSYRDSRTDGMMERAFEMMPKKEIYRLTGIQFMQLNTIFQLLSMVADDDPLLKESRTLLFMPDLFHFLLTGNKLSEYTIASTSQLMNAHTKQWERQIFENLNLPWDIMPELIAPGSKVGKLLSSVSEKTGISRIDVIAPASHDTASAVAAVPAKRDGWAYLSSGTWSLLGVEVKNPIINESSFSNNFTNEGGLDGTIRFLRNTMGLWLLQRCQKEWKELGKSFSYRDLMEMAGGAKPFLCVVDPDDNTFLNPESMLEALTQYCIRTDQPPPKKEGEIVRCIMESLALKYRFILDMIKEIHKETIEVLHIVGGGSQNILLNQFTANATGTAVVAGPTEATAVGNILVQAMAAGELAGLDEGRRQVAESFPLKTFIPEDRDLWEKVYENSKGLFS